MKQPITTSKEARNLTLQPIGGGLYVLPSRLTKQYWHSRPVADMPLAESLSGFAASLLDHILFTVPEIVVVLTFDAQTSHPLVVGVPAESFLPPSLASEYGQKIDPVHYDALRQLSLPVIFSHSQGAIYANLGALEPERAASIGYHIASEDVSISQSLRIVPICEKKAGLSFPGLTFDELKNHGVLAKGAGGYDGKNLHLLHFWVTDPAKAGLIHPFLTRLALGTEVQQASEGREAPEAYVRLPKDKIDVFATIGGPVFIDGDDLLCDPLDLILPNGSEPIHGLTSVFSFYSPCSLVDADHLLSTILSSDDGAAVQLGSSTAMGRHFFFNGEFRNMAWETDSEPIPF